MVEKKLDGKTALQLLLTEPLVDIELVIPHTIFIPPRFT